MRSFLDHYLSVLSYARDPRHVRVHVKGDLSQFEKHGLGEYKARFLELEKRTQGNKGFDLFLYVNYSTANDLQRAFERVSSEKGDRAPLRVSDILERMDQPPKIDLILRTGAAQRRRLSGFVPLRDPNTHIVFVRHLFPDLTPSMIRTAIKAHRKRVINDGV